MDRACVRFFWAICFLAISLRAAGEEYRVEFRGDMPQILKGGEVVSARMLYVSKTAQEIGTVDPQWRDFTLRFSISKSCENASLHLRFFSLAFRPEPETILFSRIEVRDAATGKEVGNFRFDSEKPGPDINFWCTGKWQNGKRQKPPVTITNRILPEAPQGALAIVSEGDPEGKLGEFHLILSGIPVEKEHDYLVFCRARADREQNLTSSLYYQAAVPQPLTYPGTTLREQVKLAKEAGVDFITFSIDNLWPKPGMATDYSVLDRVCRTILEVNPQARLIPRIDLRVPPEWWQKEHPGELMKFASGQNGGYPSVSSRHYRSLAAETLRGAIRFCEQNFGENMAGYHPTGGNTHEWFYYCSQDRIPSGYDDATRNAWRQFLQERYGSDQELQTAWGNRNAQLAQTEIPTPEERQAKRNAALLSPLADRRMIDFNIFLQKEMADTVLSLARVVREETGRRRLCIFFYGYLFELSAIANGPACSGHYALRRILSSPDIDLLCGPISYHDRQPGGGTTTMTAAESILLAGKLWTNEDDTSTHCAYRNGNRAPGWKTGATTAGESIDLLRRNLAVAAFHNFGAWWMDLFGAGWFSDPLLWEEMRRIAPLESALRPFPPAPQIAEIIDENSLLYLAPAGFERNYQSAVAGPLIKNGRADRGRTGAPLGQYLLDDLLAGRIRPKLAVVTAAWALDGTQRRLLRRVAETSSFFWCWAPGYLDLDTGEFSTAAVEDATGFRVRKLQSGSRIRPTKAGAGFGLTERDFPKEQEFADPILSPMPEERDVVLAEYGSGEPAILLRPGKVPSLFCASAMIPAELYRRFAAYAGIHLYTDRPAYVQRRGAYLSVCAPVDGEYEINTGLREELRDAFSGETIGKGPKVRLPFRKGETRIFRLTQQN